MAGVAVDGPASLMSWEEVPVMVAVPVSRALWAGAARPEHPSMSLASLAAGCSSSSEGDAPSASSGGELWDILDHVWDILGFPSFQPAGAEFHLFPLYVGPSHFFQGPVIDMVFREWMVGVEAQVPHFFRSLFQLEQEDVLPPSITLGSWLAALFVETAINPEDGVPPDTTAHSVDYEL
ncbi:hypothetical protein NDU88_005937 [Pleurodeles waltl]|uniref:Uncharacterized protein n=1 Tax=Pleurodeles waltl TaxID=8319 RepID=A0AAV7VP50_PLEWA|nr:hypothetical protein NDU88_005937 [Pleurodeles waltl]